jgi:hypothetical protein
MSSIPQRTDKPRLPVSKPLFERNAKGGVSEKRSISERCALPLRMMGLAGFDKDIGLRGFHLNADAVNGFA